MALGPSSDPGAHLNEVKYIPYRLLFFFSLFSTQNPNDSISTLLPTNALLAFSAIILSWKSASLCFHHQFCRSEFTALLLNPSVWISYRCFYRLRNILQYKTSLFCLGLLINVLRLVQSQQHHQQEKAHCCFSSLECPNFLLFLKWAFSIKGGAISAIPIVRTVLGSMEWNTSSK